MSSNLQPLYSPSPGNIDTKWARRRDVPIAILAWTALVLLLLWGAGHIIRTLLLLIIASLLAYALAPLVKIFARVMPRFLAILIVYLVVLSAISVLLYFITATAISQFASLAHYLQYYLTPAGNNQITPLESLLRSFGVSQAQITSARDQIIAFTEHTAGNAVPILTGFFDFLLDVVLIAVMSIYLLIDGSRIAGWLRRNSPRPARINFVLDTIQRVVGGYIRGQLLLSSLIGVLVGGGMAVFHVPYALLLGVLAFVFEFIPVLGTLASGAICTLIALTQGWLIAVGVLIYFIVVHILEGDVIGPRIVGKAVGLHPVVSLAALVAGSELFGIWGALFASPVAGVLQALLIAIWIQWRETHPDQFEQVKSDVSAKVDESLTDKATSSS